VTRAERAREEPRRVSVVLPAFNASATIGRAIDSLRSDPHVVEIIVADDGSTDDTHRLAAGIPGVIALEAQRAKGACAARNRGFRRSSCEYVLFLDADDHVDPAFVSHLLAAAGDNTDFVIGSHRRISGEGEVTKTVEFSPGWSRDRLIAQYISQPVQTGTVLWRRDFLAELGAWDESVIVLQDIELMLRGFVRGARYAIAGSGGPRVNWEDVDNPARISRSFNERKARGWLQVLTAHAREVTKIGPESAAALQRRLYALARMCFEAGFDEVGVEAERYSRLYGLVEHPGSFSHRIATNLLGLQGKSRWTRRLRRYREFLSQPRPAH
jgi:glycosyltransferase involved in cell wall biosynthesis